MFDDFDLKVNCEDRGHEEEAFLTGMEKLSKIIVMSLKRLLK